MRSGTAIAAVAIVGVLFLAAVGIGAFIPQWETDEVWGERYERPIFTLEPITEPRIYPGPVVPRELRGPTSLAARNPYEGNAHAIAEGYQLYRWMNCLGCHGEGGGSIGPSLWDDSWIYGSSPAEIAESILQGRPNGMPAWSGRLTEDQVWKIVAYIQYLEPGGGLRGAGE